VQVHPHARRLCELGYATVCPTYRLSAKARYPAAIEDVQACVRTLRERHRELKIDPSRIGAFGFEAGGYLAAMLGLDQDYRYRISSRVQAVVSLAGVFDLTRAHERHFRSFWAPIEDFLGEEAYQSEDRCEEASPLFHVHEEAVPFLIMHGAEDTTVPVSQSEGMAAALQEAAGRVRLHVLPDEGHNLSLEAWSKIEAYTEKFLATHLSDDEPY